MSVRTVREQSASSFPAVEANILAGSRCSTLATQKHKGQYIWSCQIFLDRLIAIAQRICLLCVCFAYMQTLWPCLGVLAIHLLLRPGSTEITSPENSWQDADPSFPPAASFAWQRHTFVCILFERYNDNVYTNETRFQDGTVDTNATTTV